MADEESEEELEQESYPPQSAVKEHLELKTYNLINQELCGYAEDIQDGYAKVRLVASEAMVVDRRGLIHSGFVFCAANFAAAAAINKPNVLLATTRCNFLAPLKIGDEVVFEASSMQNTARKRTVTVVGSIGKIKVFDGEFSVVITERHALSLNIMDA
ncbi:MAG: PaaI family thioesterase [Helicobacteraceae bacterium]|jgi:acyl-coenzyme A thioesterase PaaI-like protein|nr:PaaI family thioesterase [Helicobacteraceae bacterium]